MDSLFTINHTTCNTMNIVYVMNNECSVQIEIVLFLFLARMCVCVYVSLAYSSSISLFILYLLVILNAQGTTHNLEMPQYTRQLLPKKIKRIAET